jgi:ERCC4-type nuclease
MGPKEGKPVDRIAIQVDDRERAGAAFTVLEKSPEFEIEVARLSRGDYLVDGRMLFERRTATDFAASIVSGRLFTQALRLATSGSRPILVVEGSDDELACTGVSREAILGALVSISIFVGIPVLRTCTAEETVRMMRFAARQSRMQALGGLPRGGFRPRGKRARQLYILQGLPGIGPERARRLLAHFPTVAAIVAADGDALCAVPGIGRTVAEKVRWAVEEEQTTYSNRVTENEIVG